MPSQTRKSKIKSVRMSPTVLKGIKPKIMKGGEKIIDDDNKEEEGVKTPWYH